MPTLEWIGKDKVINHHQQVPFRVLERQYSYDLNGRHDKDNGSENMIIHGDNLEALKSLLPRYEGKVKCIYIDPPYNTGNENWVYNDNVNDPKIKKWLGEVVGKEGEDLSRHDKWLCMMYPRLKLLQRLLSDDGAIFISIDDYEYQNLKSICDEIFGISNFVKNFIWYTEGHTDNQDVITGVHEYILCYSKNKRQLLIQNIVDPNIPVDSKILRDFAENSITKNGNKNPPSIITLPIGFPCEIDNLTLYKSNYIDEFIVGVTENSYVSRELTKKYNMKYPARLDDMIVENGKLKQKCRVYSGWMNATKLQTFIDGECYPLNDNGTELRFYLSKNGVIYYYRGNRVSHYVQSVLEKMGTTETNKYMIERMGLKFDFPKPIELVSFLLEMYSDDNAIVLDSFAGSGTTAHAVLNMNKTDSGHRKFILVEMEDYAETITAERVRRVVGGYADVEGTGGDFSFYELGEALLLPDGNLNEDIEELKIREYVWYMETKAALNVSTDIGNKFFLGESHDTAYYFYYEKNEVTTLDRAFLATVREKADGYIIYADLCTLSDSELKRHNITFKKIPRDIAKL